VDERPGEPGRHGTVTAVTVEQADRVDSVTRSIDGSGYALLMTEEREFDDSDEQFQQLLAKINAYVEYIQLGQFYENYPDAAGKRLEVRLVCREEPDSTRFVRLLRTAADLFARHGAGFRVEVIPV